MVGSRAHLVDDAVAQRTFLRNILMHGFHMLVYVMCVRGIKDTQVMHRTLCDVIFIVIIAIFAVWLQVIHASSSDSKLLCLAHREMVCFVLF